MGDFSQTIFNSIHDSSHYMEEVSHPVFKPKLNAHSMCAQESGLHTYRTDNGYRITNVSV
jgi:hypothetical protein